MQQFAALLRKDSRPVRYLVVDDSVFARKNLIKMIEMFGGEVAGEAGDGLTAIAEYNRTKPDIVLSGVNRGRNVAEDVVYSGTIAGALEGTILGLPSFALSQEFSIATREAPLWDTALKFGPLILRKVIAAGIPKNTVINVNFPACAPDDVLGIRATRQGKRNLGFLRVDERRDGRGNPYFWIGFERAAALETPEEGTDLAALAARYVSVTPLRLDRTDEAFSDALTDMLK